MVSSYGWTTCPGWQPTTAMRAACCKAADHPCAGPEADRCCAREEQRQQGFSSVSVTPALLPPVVPVAALLGYTNAGKTTLLNRLTGASGTVQDQLFTTLDPLARRLRLASGDVIIVTDTVGFLHQLPHHLIEAFKATLEEAGDAQLLLHVLDASHPRVFRHAKAVESVLRQLELQDKPTITVLNKRDLIPDPDAVQLAALELAYAPSCAISAKTGQDLKRLTGLISEQLGLLLLEPTHLRLPPERASLIASVYRSGQVLARQEVNGAIELTARLPGKLKTTLSSYIVSVASK